MLDEHVGVLVLGVDFLCVVFSSKCADGGCSVHDFSLMGGNWSSLVLEHLDGLSLGLESVVPDRLGISKKHWNNNNSVHVLVADHVEHGHDLEGDEDAVHGCSNNVLNHIHIFTESLHDGSVGCHVEEQVYWGFHNAVDDIMMYLFESLINE